MENNKETKIENQFDLICPERGVGNLKIAKNCIVNGKNLDDIIAFLEYDLNKIENIEFRTSSRLIFSYNKKRIVLP